MKLSISTAQDCRMVNTIELVYVNKAPCITPHNLPVSNIFVLINRANK